VVCSIGVIVRLLKHSEQTRPHGIQWRATGTGMCTMLVSALERTTLRQREVSSPRDWQVEDMR